MKFGFKLSKLMGSVYGNGYSHKDSSAPNIVFTSDGNSILSPVGNRINMIDLVNHTSKTLVAQHRKNIRIVCLSNNSKMLLSIDVDGRAVFINMNRGLPVHRLNLKKKVRAAKFSPDDKYFAVALGKKIQIWRTPGLIQEFSPITLEKQLGGCYDDMTCLSWGSDSDHIIAGSKDLSARIFRVNPSSKYSPITLSGHRQSLVSCFFAGGSPPAGAYTIAKDGVLFIWQLKNDTTNPNRKSNQPMDYPVQKKQKTNFTEETGVWTMLRKEFLKPSPTSFAKITSAAFHPSSGILVAGFATGVFGLWELPSVSMIHTLSVGSQALKTVAINQSGEWLAMGSSQMGQLLVWEWQAETYVMKQQGHNYGLSSLDFSPNGQLIATGGEDNKVKLWNSSSGFCFVTFEEHTAPVTAVVFAQSGQVVLSSSLDGTVRCHDLVRYKCFRTLTAPTVVQLLSLAVDNSGEVICAGALDPPEIYVWSIQTGRLLDILSGHEGPIRSLHFNPMQQPILASASWDGTVRLWDVYKNSTTETLTHEYDVLAVAFRPDGHQLCSACLNGVLYFWNVENAEIEGSIEGRRDISGGRKDTDIVTAKNSAASKHFTSVCYTADGSCIIAGGESKFVCIYEISQRILVKKFQLSLNRSYDGVLDELNSKHLLEAGPSTLMDISGSEDSDEDQNSTVPGAKRGNSKLDRKSKPAIRSTCIHFSPAGREWAATTTDGLLLYSLDDSIIFDPFDLDETVTPEAVKKYLGKKEFTKAILMSLHLNELPLMVEALDSVSLENIDTVASSLSHIYLKQLIQLLAKRIDSSAHLEYYLTWVLGILTHHGKYLKANASQFSSSFRNIQKNIIKHQENLFKLCNENQYLLSFLSMSLTQS